VASNTTKVIDAIRSAFVSGATEVHAATSPVTQQHRIEAERAHIDAMEAERAPIVAAIRDMLTQGADAPRTVGHILDALADPAHAGFNDLLTSVVFAFAFTTMQNIGQPVLQPLANEAWATSLAQPLTGSEAALNVLRGYMNEQDGATEASLTGIDPDRFHTMIENSGEPPAIGEMLLLYRRGQLSEADLERAIRQSRIKPEWIDAVKLLRFAPPSAAEAIGAAVEGHLDEAAAKVKVGEAGINPENFDWMLATAGRPPGIQQLLSLENRGIIPEATVVEAIRESNVKNKYIPAILRMREKLIPYRSVPSLVSKGLITAEAGVTKLKLLGYSDEDAQAVISGATSTKVATAKHASEAQMVRGYADGLLSRDGLVSALVTFGYEPAQADFLAQLADYTRAHNGVTAAVSHTRAAYLARRIDAPTASAHLGVLGVDAVERDHLMSLWTLALGEQTTDLTVAQLVALLKATIIDVPTFSARLARHGYDPGDVALLVALHSPAPPGA
jgi:hypothetical protein